MDPTLAAVVVEVRDVLALVLAELAAVHRAVVDLTAARALADHDVVAGQRLLPAIYSAVGRRSFLTGELVLVARHDAGLRTAIEATTGPLDGGSGRRLGRLLRRLQGVPLAGIVVDAIGTERSGLIWMLRGFAGDETR